MLNNSSTTNPIANNNWTNCRYPNFGRIHKNTAANPLDDEFRYYSSVLIDLVPAIKNAAHQEAVVAWVTRLVSPEFGIAELKLKRNRYLMMISMCIQCDNLSSSPFSQRAVPGELLDPLNVQQQPSAPAAWERNKQWSEYVDEQSLFDGHLIPTCSIHHPNTCPADEMNCSIGATLDRQFQLFLHLAMPFVCKLPHALHRQKAAGWLQRLCSNGNGICALTKGIRNDYMMLLLGYLSSGLLTEPFQHYATDKLVPLKDLKFDTELRPNNKPDDPRVGRLIKDMPLPTEQGAFAFLSITGDMLGYDE